MSLLGPASNYKLRARKWVSGFRTNWIHWRSTKTRNKERKIRASSLHACALATDETHMRACEFGKEEILRREEGANERERRSTSISEATGRSGLLLSVDEWSESHDYLKYYAQVRCLFYGIDFERRKWKYFRLGLLKRNNPTKRFCKSRSLKVGGNRLMQELSVVRVKKGLISQHLIDRTKWRDRKKWILVPKLIHHARRVLCAPSHMDFKTWSGLWYA